MFVIRSIRKKLYIVLVLVLALFFYNGVSIYAKDSINMLSGSGDKSDPYIIENIDDLKLFRNLVNKGYSFDGEYVKQTRNIDLDSIENWKPIGIADSDNYFAGTYNGNGYIIENLNINNKKSDFSGFFGVLSGTVMNLGIESGNISGKYVGSIAGYARTSKSLILNCYNNAILNGTRTGGIVDKSDGKIINCWNTGLLKGRKSGGIISNEGKQLKYCYSKDYDIAFKQKLVKKMIDCEKIMDINEEEFSEKLNKNLLNLISKGQVDGESVIYWSIEQNHITYMDQNEKPAEYVKALELEKKSLMIFYLIISVIFFIVFLILRFTYKINWNSRLNMLTFISFFIIFGLLISFVYSQLSNGEALKSLVWNGNSVGVFPDLFESISHARSGNPYELKAIYPALSYVICLIFSNLIPVEYVTWESLSLSPQGVIIFSLYYSFVTLFSFYIINSMLDVNKKFRIIIMGFILFSSPYIYMLERGNMVNLTLLFILIYFYWYKNESNWKRNIALLSLAIAVSMKIYPVILGLLLVFDKRYKDAIKCSVYGILCFFLPFVAFDGFKGVALMLSNIANLSNETTLDQRGFGYGYKISISNFMNSITYWLKINTNLSNTDNYLNNLIMVLMCVGLIIVAYRLNSLWKRVTALMILVVMIPNFSWIYNGVYMIVPFIMFINENKNCKINMVKLIQSLLFIGMFMPLPYGFFMRSLSGINKMSYSTGLCNLSLLAMAILLLADCTIINRKSYLKG